MTKVTTSATKLYKILKRFKEYKNGDNTIRVWGEILGAKNIDDPIEVSDLLSQLFLLCHEVKADIKALENINPQIYLNAIRRIEFLLLSQSIINSNAEALATIQRKIHPDTLGILLASADLISIQKLAFKEIDSDRLEEVQEKIAFLQDEIKTAKIEAEIKKFLRQQLNKIEDAIELYKIRGSRELDRTTKEVLGEIFLAIWQLSKQEKEITIKFMQFLSPIHAYISLEERLQQLPEFIKKCLNLYYRQANQNAPNSNYDNNNNDRNKDKPLSLPSNDAIVDDFRLF